MLILSSWKAHSRFKWKIQGSFLHLGLLNHTSAAFFFLKILIFLKLQSRICRDIDFSSSLSSPQMDLTFSHPSEFWDEHRKNILSPEGSSYFWSFRNKSKNSFKDLSQGKERDFGILPFWLSERWLVLKNREIRFLKKISVKCSHALYLQITLENSSSPASGGQDLDHQHSSFIS